MDSLDAQLMDAVRSGKVETVQTLLEKGCRPDVGDVDNLTPLHLAAMRGYSEIAELLISKGANVNRKTTEKMAPLHFAAVRGFEKMVSLLVHRGAAVDALDSSDRTPLFLAVNRDHYKVVELLISHGAKVNMEEIHGYTPLCEAVWNKAVDMAELLLRSGAKQTQSQRLLHYSVLHRHTKMTRLLLKYGAYVNLRDDNWDTPLLIAISCCHLDTIKLLLEFNANTNYVNCLTGMTPLLKAQDISHNIGFFYEEIIKLLCLYNVDLDMLGQGLSITPLTNALVYQDLHCAVTLIKAGADVNKKCGSRCMWRDHPHTNLDMALHLRADDVVHLIVAAGFDFTTYMVEYPKDFSTVAMDTVRGWLTHMKFNPRRLDDLCRIKIRSQMGNKVLHTVPHMEIPTIIRNFLLFEDIYVKVRQHPPISNRCYLKAFTIFD